MCVFHIYFRAKLIYAYASVCTCTKLAHNDPLTYYVLEQQVFSASIYK